MSTGVRVTFKLLPRVQRYLVRVAFGGGRLSDDQCLIRFKEVWDTEIEPRIRLRDTPKLEPALAQQLVPSSGLKFFRATDEHWLVRRRGAPLLAQLESHTCTQLWRIGAERDPSVLWIPFSSEQECNHFKNMAKEHLKDPSKLAADILRAFWPWAGVINDPTRTNEELWQSFREQIIDLLDPQQPIEWHEFDAPDQEDNV